MLIGPLDVSTVNEWEPAPGALVSWHPSPSAHTKALEAPVSAVPPNYVPARHLRSFAEQAARGLDLVHRFDPDHRSVAAGLFEDAALSAQTSSDSGIDLATVPFDRVLELAPPEAGLGRPRPGNFVMSFLVPALPRCRRSPTPS